MAGLNYQPEAYDPQDGLGGGYEPLPEGDYKVAIVDSDEVMNKANTGSYIKLTMEVLDGQHAGRKVYRNLNLNNPSEAAVKIARRELDAICAALGIRHVKDSLDLHDKPMIVELVVKPGKGNYGPSNEAKNYRAVSGAKAPAPSKPKADAVSDEEIPF